MKFLLEFKPSIIEAKTKNELLTKIKYFIDNMSTVYGNNVSGVYHNTDDYIIYNIQKFNKKTKQYKNGKIYKCSTIIRKKSWKANMYFIPKNVIDAIPVHIKQNTNNFEITFR